MTSWPPVGGSGTAWPPVEGSGGTAPTFTADTPPGGTVGTAYTYTFSAAGSPAPTFAVTSGTLPAGLTLNSTTGVLSGTPTTAAAYPFVVTASNGVTPNAVSPTINVTIAASGTAPTFTADTPPAAQYSVAYTYTFTASGSPAPTFSVTSGALPTGLSLNGTTGVLSGTPTVPGLFSFVVTATNGVAPDAGSPTITIDVGPGITPTLGRWDPSNPATLTVTANKLSAITDMVAVAGTLSQGTGANQPSSGLSTIVGLNAIGFGSPTFLSSAAITQAQPVTIMAVVKLASTAGTQVAISTDLAGPQGPTMYIATVSGLHYFAFAGTGQNGAGTPDTSAHVFAVVFNGASSVIYIDGTSVGSANYGANGYSGMAFFLGKDVGNNYWGGLVGEVLVYKSALSGANITTVSAYLRAKWGTP